MNRKLRILISFPAILWLAPALGIAFTSHAVSAEDKRPNVLLIAIDDLNDWVGCLGGHPQALTPNIDALASRGVLFTNAHCQGPICGPSRASLLSGRYPHSTGVYQQPSGKALQDDREFFDGHLIPQRFAAHGYATLGCGKITHGFSPQKAFQQFGGTYGGSGPKPKQRFHYHLPDVPYSGTQTDWGAFPDRDEMMPDHKVASWSIEKLQEDRSEPFFLAVGFVRPHVPFYVPQKWFRDFRLAEVELPAVQRNDLDDVPEIARQIHEMPKYPKLDFLQANEDHQFRLAVQAYLACIRFVDDQVGRVVNALNQSKHADNTVIVLFSDHGYHLGEKNRISKHSLWEESTRVVLIVSKPGQTNGTSCSKPVGLIDLYPTLLELCGLPPKPENEGHSLVPLMDTPNASWRPAVLTTYAKENHSLRGERFRYIRYQDGSEELYDHAADPNEWHNLAALPTSAETIERFKALLPESNSDYHASTSSSPVNRWFADHFRIQGVTQSR